MPTATSDYGLKKWKSEDLGNGWKQKTGPAQVGVSRKKALKPEPEITSVAKTRANASLTFTGDALLKIVVASNDNSCLNRECISCGFITVDTTEVLPLYLPGGINVLCKECLDMVVDNQPVKEDELEEAVAGLSRILDENA